MNTGDNIGVEALLNTLETLDEFNVDVAIRLDYVARFTHFHPPLIDTYTSAVILMDYNRAETSVKIPK